MTLLHLQGLLWPSKSYPVSLVDSACTLSHLEFEIGVDFIGPDAQIFHFEGLESLHLLFGSNFGSRLFG